MKKRWTIGLISAVFAIGLIGSNAFAAKVDTRSSADGACASCARTADTIADPYPAYQPLEVCDDVCIFY